MNPYFDYHKALILDWLRIAQNLPKQLPEAEHADVEAYLERLQVLADATAYSEAFIELGQTVLTQSLARFPQLTQAIHRDLFWFFGGDCLHYMPDDEIARYQQIDDLRYETEANGETFNWEEARAKVFKLH